MGRSPRITGPYRDKGGQSLRDGGGTLVVSGAGRWRGPGHCAVLREASGEILVYHAYDAESNGRPRLRISPLVWDKDGWPGVPSLPPASEATR